MEQSLSTLVGSILDIANLWSSIIASMRYLSYTKPSDPNNKRSFPAQPKIYGRRECVKQIVDRIHVEENALPLVILGMPGVGKTCVASAVLYEDRIIERFGVRRYWADVGEVTSVDSFRDVLSESLASEAPITFDNPFDTTYDHSNPPPGCQPASSTPDCQPATSTTDRLTIAVDTLQKLASPCLIVVNDLDDVWDSDTRQILQELCSIPHLMVMITMRGSKEIPEDWRRLEMTTLSPRDAKLLFFTIYPTSDHQLDALLQKVDYLPRMVMFMAHAMHQANRIPPSELLKQGNQVAVGFLELQEEGLDSFDPSISSWVTSASGQVGPEEMRLLSILSMLPTGALHVDLHNIAPSIGEIHKIAGILSDMSLIFNDGIRLRLPSLIRPHALQYHKLDELSRRELYANYFALAKDALRRPGEKGFAKVVDRLVKEQRNVESILEDALDISCDDIAVEATLQYSAPRCAIKPRIDIVDKALEVARQNSPESLLTCRCLQRLGDMHIELGNFRTGSGLLKQAALLFEKLRYPVDAAECGFGIAKAIWINDPAGAIKSMESTWDKFNRLQDVPGQVRCFFQARCLLYLGKLYLSSGRRQEACSSIEDALSKFDQLSDQHGASQCKLALVPIYLNERRLDEAQSALEALDVLRESGDRAAVADSQNLLASLLLREGREEEARSALRKALNELEFLGRDLGSAFCMWHLADLSEDEDAIELYLKAIPKFWFYAFIFAGAECRLDLGLRYMEMGQYSDALLQLEIARPELRSNGTGWLAAFCLAAIIICLREDNQKDIAKLELDNHRGMLLDAARTRTEQSRKSRWQLCSFSIGDATASEDHALFISFLHHSRSTAEIYIVDAPQDFVIGGEGLDKISSFLPGS